ncbi:MAG: DUF1566 domain-containing protein [Thermodesulfobacteriota bacterium]
MDLFAALGVDHPETATIDWELTPADTFGTFESWGGRERVRSLRERFYYFYIDNWQQPAQLRLMERGIKHARVLAMIHAPQDMVDRCVASQGRAGSQDQSYAVDGALKDWLTAHLVDRYEAGLVTPLAPEPAAQEDSCRLPADGPPLPAEERIALPAVPSALSEEEVEALVRRYGFYDHDRQPQGSFPNLLADIGCREAIVDQRSGLMWLRGGCDLCGTTQMARQLAAANAQRLAGFADWRLPSLAEAMSLLTPVKSAAGLHVHPCFSAQQPFIFTANGRRPGGQWFVDFRHGRAYWASSTNPGGYGRFCRTL